MIRFLSLLLAPLAGWTLRTLAALDRGAVFVVRIAFGDAKPAVKVTEGAAPPTPRAPYAGEIRVVLARAVATVVTVRSA